MAVEYADFPAVEWTVYFKNTGSENTPLLEKLQAIDTRIERGPEGEFLLKHHKGRHVRAGPVSAARAAAGAGHELRFVPRTAGGARTSPSPTTT